MLKLKEIRLLQGKTQEEVAKFLNIARASYANIENRKRDPDTQTILELADYFNVSVDYLMGRTMQKQPPAKGEGLKEKVVNRLDSLTPQELQRVDDFLSGIQSAHKEP